MSDVQKKISDSFDRQGLMETFGATLRNVADGEVQIVLPHSKHLSQQHGYVHGGAIASILDAACGYAALTKAPVESEVVTSEYKINFLRPAIGKYFLAVGKVTNAGKLLTVCTGEVRAFDVDESSYKIVAVMQATMVNVHRTS
jgi:uncharacterized protein (TIGR00369 family)